MSGATAAIAAGAAVVGVGSSIMQGQEAKEQANKQYEAQQAAFSDDIQAAITNAQWSLKDNNVQYGIDNQQREELMSIAIDSLMDKGELEQFRADGKSTLDALKNIMSSEIDSDDLIKNMKVKAKEIAKEAQINMDYTIAMAEGRQGYNTDKAIIDSMEYAGLAQAAVTFLDQEINSIKEQMNFALETADINGMEAIGKVSSKLGSTLAGGTSASRVMMNTKIKADRIKKSEETKYESAIDKAIATQNKSITEADVKAKQTMNTAMSQNALITKETISSLARQKDLRDTSLNTVMASTENSLESLHNTLNDNLELIGRELGLTSEGIDKQVMSQMQEMIGEYTVDKDVSTQKYTQSKLQTMRGLEQSYATAVESSTDKANKLLEYANLTNTQEYSVYSKWAKEQGIPTGLDNILGKDYTQLGISSKTLEVFNQIAPNSPIQLDTITKAAEQETKISRYQGAL